MTPPLSTLNLATQPTLASPGDRQFKLDPVDRIHWRRTTRKRPCPVCHRYGWCEISDNEKWAHCMHMPNHKPMRWRGGGWLHQLQGEVSGPKAEVKVGLNSLWVPAQTSTPPPPLAPALIDQVNRALL